MTCTQCQAELGPTSTVCHVCGAPEPTDGAHRATRPAPPTTDKPRDRDMETAHASSDTGPVWSTTNATAEMRYDGSPSPRPHDTPSSAPASSLKSRNPAGPAGQGGALPAAVPPVAASVLTMAAAAALLLLTMINWYDFDGFRLSLWQANSGGDILVLLQVLATVAAGAIALATGLRAARMLAGGVGLLLAGMAMLMIAEPLLGGHAFAGSVLAIPVTLALVTASALQLVHATDMTALGTIVQNGRTSRRHAGADRTAPRSTSPFGVPSLPARGGPDPGWYADPSGEFAERRWDGTRWTHDTR